MASLTAGCLLFCELDGRVLGACGLGCWWRCCLASLTETNMRLMLGGMRFGVLVEVLFCEIDGWALGAVFASLTAGC